jgi:uncharacterized metal-binding protein YceD (DUF177 family)
MIEKNAAWSVPVNVEDIPAAGLHVEIDAPAEARAAVTELAAVRDVAHLSAELDLARRGAGVRVSGRVQARIGQTCVVTLEPVENEIDEPVDVIFAPPDAGAQAAAKDGSGEPPDALTDGKIDLAAVATEFLILGIDPYPRKPGAEFSTQNAEDEGDRPFAALAALKRRSGGAQSGDGS